MTQNANCRRNDVHCVTLEQIIEFQRGHSWSYFYLDGYTIVKSELFNNMNHIRNSDIEPSSVLLNKIRYFIKLKYDVQRMSKQVETKRNGVKNPHHYIYKSILNTDNFVLLKRLRRSWSRP